jgi:hypothetical protein
MSSVPTPATHVSDQLYDFKSISTPIPKYTPPATDGRARRHIPQAENDVFNDRVFEKVMSHLARRQFDQ